MSEYWKSTPKYWCKFCKTYVRDTKFEKQQHEATPKHQSNIQRSLRGLHRDQEREEREKQRAKDEVARLNGIVPGSGSSSASKDPPWKKPTAPSTQSMQTTPEERKRQLTKLAEMGVAIPEEFRREMAMAGDWQVLAEKPVVQGVKGEEGDVKLALNIGVRKRKLEGEDEEDEASKTITRKKGWGSTYKAFPGAKGPDDNLDALFKNIKPGSSSSVKNETAIKEEPDAEGHLEVKTEIGVKAEADVSEKVTKVVPSEAPNTGSALSNPPIKTEEEVPTTDVIFKKRKKKAGAHT